MPRPQKPLGYETVAREQVSRSEVVHKRVAAVDLRLTSRDRALLERLYFTDGSMLQLQLYPVSELDGRYYAEDPANEQSGDEENEQG